MSVINVDEAVKKGFVIKFGNDLTVGPVEDKNNPLAKVVPSDQIWPRKPELWEGTPPLNSDNKVPKVFPTSEECGLKTLKGKCKQKLNVHRIMNETYEKDTHGFGGQMQYIENDTRYYKQCPIHGPNPPGPEFSKELGSCWPISS